MADEQRHEVAQLHVRLEQVLELLNHERRQDQADEEDGEPAASRLDHTQDVLLLIRDLGLALGPFLAVLADVERRAPAHP